MTDTMTRLEAVLGEQHGLYTRLDELSAAQAELIAADRTDELLALLTERSGIVARLEASGSEMQAVRAELDAAGGVAEPDRGRLQAMVAEVRTVAARVAERDAADERALAERRDSLSTRLSGNARGRSAVSAYGRASQAGATGPKFQDRSA